MDFDVFKRIVTAFSDDPEDIDLKHGKLLVQVRDEVIEAALSQSSKGVMVTENGDRLTARSWVVRRLARLPQLADRICSHDESPQHFVVPSGRRLGHEEFASDAGNSPGVEMENIVTAMADTLGSRIPGTTSVWYLTSDAGEGKTSLINHLAVEQARAYKQKRTEWLLVPIPLGGRTFLRFDDVVVAALANRLRFQLLYYDAFLELVRLGVIVPAFDGFEEMIIEGKSGEAVSALGQLLNNLDSAGAVLIAARKAYFEYMSFRSQARLFDAIGKNDVAFGRMSLARWDRAHFIKYGSRRGLDRPDTLHQQVASSLGETHPLLTRAVLVRRLVDVATEDGSDLSGLLGRLVQQPQDYFREFVSAIIEREARVKWMDKSGEPAQPLLTVDEHHLLLSMVAHEMWLSSTDDLKADEVDFIADMFTEEREKSPAIARQVRERLKQHALLVRTRGDRGLGFDHEDFRLFYLGFALGCALVKSDVSAVNAILEVTTLPRDAVDQAASCVRRDGDAGSALELLQKLATPQLPTSFVRENCGALTAALADGRKGSGTAASHMNFPGDTLRGRSLSALTVSDSHFSPTSLEGAALVDCRFVRCRFERLDGNPERVEGTRLDECDVASVAYADDEYDAVEIYEPEHIRRRLDRCGFQIQDGPGTRPRAPAPASELSGDLKLVQRALRVFTRATGVNEKTMQTRLGVKFNRFSKGILPRLLDAGVLEELRYEGKGNQRRFGIAVPMQEIEFAMEKSGGELERFVDSFGIDGSHVR